MSTYDIVQPGNNEWTLRNRLKNTNTAGFGAGSSDSDIAYTFLRNASGTKVYIYPDSTGTALVVTTARP